ncbi:segregation and condensation protein A [Streptomyces roseolilacinus]|uniref:segregation and condensation protein A n=1 Tax=Streptomyces roseolilacinus TaxID=66904 RepID=UPI0037F278DF
MPPTAPRRRPLGRGPAVPAGPGPHPTAQAPGGPTTPPAGEEPPREEPPPGEPLREGPPRGEPPHDEPPREEPPREEPPHDEPPHDEPPRPGTAADEPVGGPAGGPDRRSVGAAGAATGEGADGDGGGARGEGRFTVRLANFEGPFDLLLQLIARHRLDITEVALSKVTDEFMAHLRAMGPEGDLDQTTEFLVVAATLLDLKAARLLPAAEVEDEADLALLEARDLLFARLLQYRAYKRVAAVLGDRLDHEGRRHPRTVGLEPHHARLLPEVVLGIGPEGLARLAVKAMQPRPRPQVYVDHVHAPLVSVREQAGIVVARLRERGELRFRELAEDAADTLTVVARFLALLELYREKVVALDQDDPLGELTVRWTGGDAEAAVTDEFDRVVEPEQEEGT